MTDKEEKGFLDIVKGATGISNDLGLSKKEKVELYKKVLDKFNIPSSFLDVALEKDNQEEHKIRKTDDLYSLLNDIGADESELDFATKLIIKGYLQLGLYDEYGYLNCTLTTKGQEYGIADGDNTFPLFYKDTFKELYNKVMDEE